MKLPPLLRRRLSVFFAVSLSPFTLLFSAEDPPIPLSDVRFVVITNKLESPDFAQAHLAENYEDLGTVAYLYLAKNKKQQFFKKEVKAVVPIPNRAVDFVNGSQFTEAEKCLNGLTQLVETYPRLRDPLLPLGKELKTIVDFGKQGLVKYGGTWSEKGMKEGKKNAAELLTIRDTSGKEYQNSTVKKVEPDGLLVQHSGGVSKVLFLDLPKELQDQYGFDPIEAEQFRKSRETAMVTAPPSNPPSPEPSHPDSTTTRPPAPPTTAVSNAIPPDWTPTSIEDVASCALFVKVLDKVGAEGDHHSGGGSAFLCNVDGATYIYSNVHNFDGTKDFVIIDQNGRRYDRFSSVEIAAQGQGYNSMIRKGGDVIRLRLPEYQPRALSLADQAISEESVGKDVLITGNTRDRGKITKLTGKITGIGEEQIIENNTLAQGGNSGSPIVAMDTFRVIGIFTWGAYRDDDPVFDLWSKKSDEEREGVGSGPSIVGMKFEATTLEAIYRHRLVFNQMKENTRLLAMLDTLYPRKEGVFVDTEQVVMGDYTVIDLLQEFPDHFIVNELTELHEMLEEKYASNVGISNQDMFKAYITAYRYSLEHVRRFRKKIEPAQAPTFYMQCQFASSNILKICEAYEMVIYSSLEFYDAQSSTHAEVWPVTKRIRLPAFRSGLDGLLRVTEKK